ncbi:MULTISPECIES: STAS domain-containing protein [Calothrix]|uniref:Anti-sigma factor antagonist n=2 Tax=Calothrix TaxID=1186 RepID=A0ABR8A8H1_9CYAN|nr:MULTISPECIES: STAS domain-containing protein [Calothrix]MBD2196168.1 STAS domain-containing protein [Calothrix parietina FACHB-288]MBD2224821.1 STAS domain-containing protein [Calothrix anomala FACHB-343]
MDVNKTDAKKEFSATLKTVATITLSGELTAASAPIFKAEVEKALQQGVNGLVLFIQELDYIASAGLRVLIFAKQKMDAKADIYVVGGQEQVLDTLEKTGFDQGVILQDTYKPL